VLISGALNEEFIKKKNENPVVGDFADIMVNKVDFISLFFLVLSRLLIYQIEITLSTVPPVATTSSVL
jgi:hypothetical protein